LITTVDDIKAIVMLEDEYGEEKPKFNSLKNKDRLVASVLKTAISKSNLDFDLYLGTLILEKSGVQDEHSKNEYDFDDYCDIEEVFSMSSVVDIDDNHCSLNIEIENEGIICLSLSHPRTVYILPRINTFGLLEVYPPNAFDKLIPDDEEIIGSRDEGTTMDLTYRRPAFVLQLAKRGKSRTKRKTNMGLNEIDATGEPLDKKTKVIHLIDDDDD